MPEVRNDKEFLDLHGLEHFWNNVKNYLDMGAYTVPAGKQVASVRQDHGKVVVTFEAFGGATGAAKEAARESLGVSSSEEVEEALAGKADLVDGAVEGNLAALDAEGNLVDSGVDPDTLKRVQEAWSDEPDSALYTLGSIGQDANGVVSVTFVRIPDATASSSGLMSSEDKGKLDGLPDAAGLDGLLAGKADKVENPVPGNLAGIDSEGNLEDSGYSVVDTTGEGFSDNVPTGGAVLEAIGDAVGELDSTGSDSSAHVTVTVVQADGVITDVSVSDTAAAADHVHGNISNDGKVGSASGKYLVTGENGVVEAGDLPVASTSAAGIVQLSSSIDSTSETMAATPKAVRDAIIEAEQATVAGLDATNSVQPGYYITEVNETDGIVSITTAAMDDAPTQGSTKPVKSGGVYGSIKDEHDARSAFDDWVNGLIPDASKLDPMNKLADKAYVDAIGERVEARYLSYSYSEETGGLPFPSYAAFAAAQQSNTFYYIDKLTIPNNNDVIVITADETHRNDNDQPCTTRYRFFESEENPGTGEWRFEYVINNSALNSEQLLAINSGITSTKVESYDAHVINQANPHNVTAEQVGLGNVNNTADLDKPISTATQTALNQKVDKITGAHENNILVVGGDNRTEIRDSGAAITKYYEPTDEVNPVTGSAVAAAIGLLDVDEVGGAGKYISAISETDGKISATVSDLDAVPTAGSTNAITSGAVKQEVDTINNSLGGKADKVSGAVSGNFAGLDANGNLTDSGCSPSGFKLVQTAVNDPVSTTNSLSFISSISQDTQGVITPVKATIPKSDAVDSADSNTLATSAAVKAAYDHAGSATAQIIETLDAEETSTDGTNVQVKVTEVDGKITAVNVTTDNTVNSAGVASAINTALGGLDYTDTAVTHQFVTGVSENDGVISVSREQPDIDDIDGLSTALAGIGAEKADKVDNAVAGNFAGLDGNGNLVDSGSKASDFKTKQSAVSDPTASGTALSFIDTLSQDANGEITATKKTVAVDSTYNSSGTNPVNGQAVAAAIGTLDSSESGSSTHVSVEVVETDGKITGVNVTDTAAASDHVHGQISNDGKIGATSDLAVYTTTGGEVTAGSLATADPSPSAVEDTVVAIDSISQDSKGKITATKKPIRSASTSQSGIVRLYDGVDGTSTVMAATANAVKEAYDHADAALAGLDAEVTSTDGTNVQVKVTQVDGEITAVNVTTDNTVSSSDVSGAIGTALGALDAEETSTDGTNVQVKVTQVDGEITAVNITTDNTENRGNKVSEWSATVNDTNYPTEKLVKDSLDDKVDKESGKGLSTNDYTTAEKTKLDGIETGAEVNQNAFSNVAVGAVTVAADSKTDTVEFVGGTGIELTGNTSDNSVTFALDSNTQTAVGKASSSVQSVSIDGTAVSKDSSGNVDIPLAVATGSASAKAGAISAADKKKLDDLGSAAYLDVPVSGNAGSNEVVLGSDTRLSSGASAVQDVTVDGTSVVNSTTKVATIPDASTSDKGVVQLAGSIGATVSIENGKAATEKAVRDAIDALDVSNISGFGQTKTLATLSETDGKISATFQEILAGTSNIADDAITAAKVKDGETLPVSISGNAVTATTAQNYDTSTGTIKTALASKEDKSNKIQSISSSATGLTTEYPSAQAVIDFVNSSISTGTADFLGNKDVVDDLGLTTSATNPQIAAALGTYVWPAGVTPTNNDYVFVSVDDPDTAGVDEYRRFKYDGSVWQYEYTLNNSSFTQAQWAAINSGITATDKSAYDTHVADATIHVTAADKTAWNAKYDKPSGGIPSTDMTNAVQASLGKADSAIQGVVLNGTTLTPDASKVVDLGDLKTKQTAVTDPVAEGTAINFINSISQDTNGVITATKRTIRPASASQSGVMSASDFSKLAGIESGAEANQNAFSNVKVGDVTVAADSKTDTLTLVAGTNVQISADASTDSVTISATDTTYDADRGISLVSGKFGHSNTAVTGASVGPTAAVTGVSVSVPRVTFDNYGHITAASDKTFTVQDGTTSQKGVVQLQDSIGATETEDGKAATPKSVRSALDEKVNIANIDLDGETTTIRDEVRTLAASGLHYARFYTRGNGGADNITDKPVSGSGFLCEARCDRYANSTDYIYQLTCWVGTDTNPYVAIVRADTTSIAWSRLNVDTKVKATAKTDNANYKILATSSASPSSGSNTEAVYDTDITLNPSTNTISANLSGNASTASAAQPGSALETAINGKADVVSGATAGNFAGLDANGNLTDSGSKASDFKTVQTAKSDPTASGTTITAIATISQDTNGVISATKSTIRSASASQSGVMSKEHYSKLEDISTGANKVESSTTNGNIKIDGTETTVYTHPTSGANVSKGDTTNQTPGFGSTFKVTSATVDSMGHTTVFAEHTVKIPNATAVASTGGTGGSAGLMSAADKEKLNGIDTELAGKKDVQSAVADPSASGTSLTFISNITQDAQGVISPSKKTVSTMGAASSSAAGTAGIVPAPGAGKQESFLRGDGTWVVPANTDTKVKATAKTDNVNYKILATASASPTSGNATEAVYDTDISLNPSTNTITSNISGNAATATKPAVTTLTSSDNLNSVGGSAAGDVLWYKWASGSAPTNVPTTGSAVMEVVRTHSGNYITQTVYTTEHSVYRRECINGTWGAWYSYSKSTHTHGNITTGGALQTTDATIANGDKLVITDASDSNKIARSSTAFDGSTITKALTQKGTFESVMLADDAMPLSATDGVKITYSGSTATISGNFAAGAGVGITYANNVATFSADISAIPLATIYALS